MYNKSSFIKTASRILSVLLCLVMLVLALTACGGNDSTSTPTPSKTSASSGHGTLNLTDSGPITLDPAVAAETTSSLYILQIFSGLVRLDEQLKVTPDIAASWDVSADGKTFTFHLLQSAKFHDGKGVKASDFKYSWERALNPATNSLTAGTYLSDIVGAKDIISGAATELSGVSVIDDYTLQVTIDAPKAYFLEKMAYPTAFVVDKTNVQSGANWWQHPNATGPFKLKQYEQDQSVILERSDNYYGEKAKLKQVVFSLYSGGSLQQYQEGKIDVSYISSDYMGMITDPSNPISKELQTYPELSLSYIGFNTQSPPFDDIKVRQAFCYAVDKEKLIKLSVQDAVTVANGILPPGINGYNADLKGLSYDPEKAKELIAESKYGSVSNFPPIVLTTSGWGGYISGLIGGVIEEWRRNLGVEVTVRQLEPEQYLYTLKQEKNQLYDLGWIADYPDPQDFLDTLFRTGEQNNVGEYSNTALDSLLDQAAIEKDTNARMTMYQDAEKIVVQDAAMLPLLFGRNYVLVKPYVKDFVLTPMGYPILSKVSIQD